MPSPLFPPEWSLSFSLPSRPLHILSPLFRDDRVSDLAKSSLDFPHMRLLFHFLKSFVRISTQKCTERELIWKSHSLSDLRRIWLVFCRVWYSCRLRHLLFPTPPHRSWVVSSVRIVDRLLRLKLIFVLFDSYVDFFHDYD